MSLSGSSGDAFLGDALRVRLDEDATPESRERFRGGWASSSNEALNVSLECLGYAAHLAASHASVISSSARFLRMEASLAGSWQLGHFLDTSRKERIHWRRVSYDSQGLSPTAEQKEWPHEMLTGPWKSSLQMGHTTARSSRRSWGNDSGKGTGSVSPAWRSGWLKSICNGEEGSSACVLSF